MVANLLHLESNNAKLATETEVRAFLNISNVEDVALSTWAGSTNLVTAGALSVTSLSTAGTVTFTGKTRLIGGDDTLYIGTADRPSAYGYTGSAYFVLDKAGTADDCSIVMRDNGNCRAEIGLVTDNDIHFKTATGTYLSEIFTDRLIIKGSGYVDVFNSILRVNNPVGIPTLIVGNSDGSTAGAGIEIVYDQPNTVGWIRSIERGNTYRTLNIESNGINFWQGAGSTSVVATLSNAGAFAATALTVNTVGLAATAVMSVATDAGQIADLSFYTGSTRRWAFRKQNGAESGGDVGSNLELGMWNDAGSTKTTIFDITRPSGVLDFKIAPTINGVGLMQQSWTLTAGNGMTGGGSGAANRTITLGTPGSITLSSLNAVTATSHTHAFAPGGTISQYIRGDGSLATLPTGGSGTVTSVSAGNGMNFTTITGAGSVTLGTPGTLTGSTTNAVTATSHTHALSANLSAWDAFSPISAGLGDVNSLQLSDMNDSMGAASGFFRVINTTLNLPVGVDYGTGIWLSYSNINGVQLVMDQNPGDVMAFRGLGGTGTWNSWKYVWHDGNFDPSGKMDTTWSITAGNGLTGGGNGTANRTLTLGTPGTLTGTTTNSVTGTSHTHAVTSYALTYGNGLTGGSFNGFTAADTISLGTPGTLDESTANAVTATSHTHNVLLSYLYNTDNRTTPLRVDPADYTDRGLSVGFNSGANLGIASTYGMSLHLATWTVYNAAYRQHQLNFAGDGSGIYWRFATSDTTWGTTYKVLTEADIDSADDNANTLVGRNGSGDIFARLVRTSFADQSTMSGAITFRVNSTTDNYDRHCNSPAAVKGWLSLDSKDIPMVQATITSTATESANNINMILEKANTSAYTRTISTGTSACATGSAITYINSGTAGNLTIAQGTSVTIVRNGVTGSIVLAPGSMTTLVKSVTANKWVAA